MARKRKADPAPATTVDPVRSAIYSFAIVHQNWAAQESASRAASELGYMWNILLHDRFLKFCEGRGLREGKIVLSNEGRASVVIGSMVVDWASRYYDDNDPDWPMVREVVPVE